MKFFDIIKKGRVKMNLMNLIILIVYEYNSYNYFVDMCRAKMESYRKNYWQKT